jgi:hypothetical protein
MSEQTGIKLVISRNTAIAFGIICIILAVGMIVAFVSYSSMHSQIEDKDFQISSLNSQIADKDSQIQNLTSQKNELQDIVNLDKSIIWVNGTVSQPARQDTVWTFTADYAGYVIVRFQSSNDTHTFVRVIYFSYGVDYDNQIGVETDGRAVFPILPSKSIEIRVGTLSPVASSITLTVIYYY